MGPNECIEGSRLRHFDIDVLCRIFQQCLVAMFRIEKMMACFPVLFQKKVFYSLKVPNIIKTTHCLAAMSIKDDLIKLTMW